MEKNKEKTEEKKAVVKETRASVKDKKESEFDKRLQEYFMWKEMFEKKEDLKRKMRIDVFY